MWQFEADNQTQWFHIYRAGSPNANEAERVSLQFIPAQVHGTHFYEFVDTTVERNGIYFYWVEQVARGNIRAKHGPKGVVIEGLPEPLFLPLINNGG